MGRLFSEDEKEEETMDFMLARVPLPDREEGETATGAILED